MLNGEKEPNKKKNTNSEKEINKAKDYDANMLRKKKSQKEKEDKKVGKIYKVNNNTKQ